MCMDMTFPKKKFRVTRIDPGVLYGGKTVGKKGPQNQDEGFEDQYLFWCLYLTFVKSQEGLKRNKKQ